jgi:hypothetical protein
MRACVLPPQTAILFSLSEAKEVAMTLQIDIRAVNVFVLSFFLAVFSTMPVVTFAQAPATKAQPSNALVNTPPIAQTNNSQSINAVTGQTQAAGQSQNFNAQYAGAALKLAELTLRQAVEANQQFPGTYSAVTIRCLQSQVAIAQSRLEVAQNGGNGGLKNILLGEIDGNLRIAEAKLQNAMAGGKPRPAQSTDVQLLQLAVEVERLAAERAKSPSASLAELLQWQIEELHQQLVQQQLEIDQLVTLIRQ